MTLTGIDRSVPGPGWPFAARGLTSLATKLN